MRAHAQNFSDARQQGAKEKFCKFFLLLRLKTRNLKILARILGCAPNLFSKNFTSDQYLNTYKFIFSKKNHFLGHKRPPKFCNLNAPPRIFGKIKCCSGGRFKLHIEVGFGLNLEPNPKFDKINSFGNF